MKRLFKVGTFFAFVFAFFVLFQGVATAAPLNYMTERLYGSNRVETAILISQRGWEHADTVLLARADNYPDSLVSVPLAKQLDAPILLTASKSLNPEVLEEIGRLGASKVILLGGEGAIGPEVAQALEQARLSWERLGGNNRFETAALVAARLGSNGQVILASGENFPDALAIGPYAGITQTPILLVKKNQMPPETEQALKVLDQYFHQDGYEGIKYTYVIGGENVISNTPLKGLNGVTRIAGENRFETAAKVYYFTREQLGDIYGDPQSTYVPSNENAEMENPEQSAGDNSTIHNSADGTMNTGEQANPDSQTNSQQSTGQSSEQSGLPSNSEQRQQQQSGDQADQTNQSTNGEQTAPQGSDQSLTEGFTPPIYLVTGENFPDALVAGALAAKQNAWLFMASKDNLPAYTYAAMGNAYRDGSTVILIGGENALTERVAGIVAGTIQPPYLLAGLTIVVDPGHGGKDPGAIASTGAYEKDNTLPVAQYLADLLRAAGANAVLTRNSDVSPASGKYAKMSDLEARVAIAEDHKADLFVSIHNNSATTSTPYGTETYYSKDSVAAAESKILAQNIQRQIIKELSVYNRGEKDDRGVKEAKFYVLHHTTMPAALIELGFISNPYEETLLKSPEFQQKAALGIYRGILTYRGY